MHAHKETHTYTYIHIHICTRMYTHTRTYIHMHTHVHSSPLVFVLPSFENGDYFDFNLHFIQSAPSSALFPSGRSGGIARLRTLTKQMSQDVFWKSDFTLRTDASLFGVLNILNLIMHIYLPTICMHVLLLHTTSLVVTIFKEALSSSAGRPSHVRTRTQTSQSPGDH